MDVLFNGERQPFGSTEEFGVILDHIAQIPVFELWVHAENGASLSMLRNGDHAWLMYLRFEGDDGFVSCGDRATQGICEYRLSNGQVDEYPLSWCLELERCYNAVTYFIANEGAQTPEVAWRNDFLADLNASAR